MCMCNAAKHSTRIKYEKMRNFRDDLYLNIILKHHVIEIS